MRVADVEIEQMENRLEQIKKDCPKINGYKVDHWEYDGDYIAVLDINQHRVKIRYINFKEQAKGVWGGFVESITVSPAMGPMVADVLAAVDNYIDESY